MLASTPAGGLKAYEFGFAGAEEEGAYKPDLLLSGYHDPEGLIDEALNGRRFLFLGYKGSGKSAIGQHLRLLAQNRHDLFVHVVSLNDFPFTPFKRILKGDAEPETKYPTAWCWLFLLYFFESFSQDNGQTHIDVHKFETGYSGLKTLGLVPAPDLRRAVLASAKTTFSVQLAGVKAEMERGYERQDATDLPFFIDYLKNVALGFRSPNRHVLVIDGLDDVLTKREVRYEALSGLVFEANRLNQCFAEAEVPAKVLVLCRTDLFERLPGAHTNKIRQDSAVQLDWYRDTRNVEESSLITLINRRARMSVGAEIDIFSTHFPKVIDRHQRSEEQDTRAFLLDLTRHTPRDFIMVMRRMQDFAKQSRLSKEDVLKGATAYSKEYFLPEIKNELSGYVSDAHVQMVIELMGSLRKREFFCRN
jgi:hypothetical protein